MEKQIINIDIAKDGSVSQNARAIRAAFLLFAAKRVTVTIQERRKLRSNQQGRYLWGCIYPLMQLGFKETHGVVMSKEEVHEWCKMQFNYVEVVNEATSEVVRVPRSTTTNDTYNQEVYHEEIRRFAFEWFNLIIPLPNEDLELNLDE